LPVRHGLESRNLAPAFGGRFYRQIQKSIRLGGFPAGGDFSSDALGHRGAAR